MEREATAGGQPRAMWLVGGEAFKAQFALLTVLKYIAAFPQPNFDEICLIDKNMTVLCLDPQNRV